MASKRNSEVSKLSEIRNDNEAFVENQEIVLVAWKTTYARSATMPIFLGGEVFSLLEFCGG